MMLIFLTLEFVTRLTAGYKSNSCIEAMQFITQ